MKKIICLIVALALALCSSVICADCAEALRRSGDWEYYEQDGAAVINAYLGSDSSVTVPGQLDGKRVSKLGSYAFFNSNIENIIIPSNVGEIGWWTFYGCQSLSSVSLVGGLSSIGCGAFMNCPKLLKISLPGTVCKIESDAFAVSCKNSLGEYDKYSKQKVSVQKYSVNSRFVIEGYYGTAAEKYADDNGLIFKSLGEIRFGDLNGDEVIDSGDLSLLRLRLDCGSEFSLDSPENADLDCDGRISENDWKLLKKYVDGKAGFYSFPATERLMPDCEELHGISMYCDGDSVAKGTGTNILGSGFHSYCNAIAQKYNMRLTNKAVPGTTLARREGFKNSILERILRMRGSYDLILLDGGFNDLFKNVPIGKVSSDFDKSGVYNEYTTAGALETICYFLEENYSSSMKFFVLCHNRTKSPREREYWDLIISVLDKWGIPYADLMDETELSDINREITNQYFYYREQLGFADGVHPLGYTHDKIYAPVIERGLIRTAQSEKALAFGKRTFFAAEDEEFFITPDAVGFNLFPELKWTSSNSETAAVNNGLVRLLRQGETVIRAEAPDGTFGSFVVKSENPPSCVYLSDSELNLNLFEQAKLKAKFIEGTTSRNLEFSSSDYRVCSVTNGGVLTATGEGNAVITCKASNGISAHCVVNVTRNTINGKYGESI